MISKKIKIKIINNFNKLFKNFNYYYIIDISTYKSNQLFILKKDCYKYNIKLFKIKNSLFKKFLIITKKKKILNNISAILKNNNSIMFSNSPNIIANIIKKNKLLNNNYPILKLAYIDDVYYYGDNNIDILCNLKSKNELIYYIIFILKNKIIYFLNFIINYKKIKIVNINKLLFNKLKIN
ncbi:50S ribosomal protein L10 [Candidatus Shikimatogenerans bostrichidophilus]|uniref:50S ribosomal protein L10 n=1 Tax=Candidatus Shikimatogenerans bostrichidophilus TaxID=2943807 RepID=UPI002965EC81